GGNKGVPTPRNSCDEPALIGLFPQCAAQGGHALVKIAFFDDRVRPNRLNQFFLLHHMTGVARKGDQRLERPRSDRDGNGAAPESPGARVQFEVLEFQNLRSWCVRHSTRSEVFSLRFGHPLRQICNFRSLQTPIQYILANPRLGCCLWRAKTNYFYLPFFSSCL